MPNNKLENELKELYQRLLRFKLFYNYIIYPF